MGKVGCRCCTKTSKNTYTSFKLRKITRPKYTIIMFDVNADKCTRILYLGNNNTWFLQLLKIPLLAATPT